MGRPVDGHRERVNDAQRPELTIVIPAYNEEQRLPATLAAIDRYLSDTGVTAEVIVADDGSTDHTAQIARQYSPATAKIVVLSLPHRGKAFAVRDGILNATADYVLFTDADLSTPMRFAPALIEELRRGAGVAIGSREGIGARRVGEPAYRHLMGRVFNFVVRALAVPGIDDTQCGFKAFRAETAREIFALTRLHDPGDIRGPRVSGFDVEVLFIARRLGYRIATVPVYWEHVPGSKVRPLQDSALMFLDVVRVRLNALRGLYDPGRDRIPA